MEIVIQRVKEASVDVDNETVGSIKKGLLLLVGFSTQDSDIKPSELERISHKVLNLRCFSDKGGKMNLSVLDIKGQILAVSQFTLIANLKKGNRPSFVNALEPRLALRYFDNFCDLLRKTVQVQKGIFGADMQVNLLNDGPVTFIMNSDTILGPRS